VKLIIVDEKSNIEHIVSYNRKIKNEKISKNNYDGLSTLEIHVLLINEDQDCLIITADSRFLLFQDFIGIDNIYISYNLKVKNIRDCITKEIKNRNNVFRMYEAGAFIY